MEIKDLYKRPNIVDNPKLSKAFDHFDELLLELKKREFPEAIIQSINIEIEQINTFLESEKELRKRIRYSQSSILKLIEKDLKIVPKNHYQNIWLTHGMSAFGLPLGVAFGASLGNMGLLAIGIPIGMLFGLAIGSYMDKKAFRNGKQLNFEIRWN